MNEINLSPFITMMSAALALLGGRRRGWVIINDLAVSFPSDAIVEGRMIRRLHAVVME